MINLNKVTAVTVKLIIFLVGLSIAVIPIVYIIGTEPLHTQPWHTDFEHLSSNSPILEQINNSTVFNIYLKEDSKSFAWSEIKQISKVADYVSHELQQKGAFVRRKFLQFKAPQSKKAKKGQTQNESPRTTNKIDEAPLFSWMKNIIQPFIFFEHDGFDSVNWVIVTMGELQSKIVDEIKKLKKQNPGYKFILISLNQLKSKVVENSAALIAAPLPVKQSAKALETKAQNDGKTKKDSKQVKEPKEGKEGRQSKKSKAKVVQETDNATVQQL